MIHLCCLLGLTCSRASAVSRAADPRSSIYLWFFLLTDPWTCTAVIRSEIVPASSLVPAPLALPHTTGSSQQRGLRRACGGSGGLTFPCQNLDEDWNRCLSTHELPGKFTGVSDVNVSDTDGSLSRSMTIKQQDHEGAILDRPCRHRDCVLASASRHWRSVDRHFLTVLDQTQ